MYDYLKRLEQNHRVLSKLCSLLQTFRDSSLINRCLVAMCTLQCESKNPPPAVF